MFIAGNSAITNIQNVGLVNRYDQLAVRIQMICAGSQFSADGVLQRGTIMVPASGGDAGKWRPFVHGTDTLAVDGVRIVVDDIKVNSGQDAFVPGYSEGFFKFSSLQDANTGLVLGDLTVAAGFHPTAGDEIRLK
jgi:hypothetical protein